MNSIDFNVSHDVAAGHALQLSPFLGVKAAAINQTIQTNWNAVLYTSTENVKNNFAGMGPSIGVDAQWNANKLFSVVSTLSTAFMWGHWDVQDIYVRPNVPGVVTASTISTTMNHAELGTMMLDYFIGVQWTPKPLMKFKLGYEMQYWPNQLRLLTFQQLPLHGDLTFQGATCGLFINLS